MRAAWLVLATMLVAASAARADPVPLKDTVPHITTTGTASTEVVPDRAVLHLSVSSERPDADAASQATAKAADDIVAAAKAKGVEAKDIKTNLDMSAQYDPVLDAKGRVIGQKLRGYLVKEAITIRLLDVGKVGALAREAVSDGATEIDGIDFRFSRRKETLRELNAVAMRDARDEAKSYVEAVGSKLGRLLQVGDDPEDHEEVDLPSRVAVPARALAKTTSFPMEPGTRKLNKSVTATWEIEGGAP